MLCIWAKMVKDGTVTLLKELKYHLETTGPGISECSMKILEDLIIVQQGMELGGRKKLEKLLGKVTRRRKRVRHVKQELQRQRKWCV